MTKSLRAAIVSENNASNVYCAAFLSLLSPCVCLLMPLGQQWRHAKRCGRLAGARSNVLRHLLAFHWPRRLCVCVRALKPPHWLTGIQRTMRPNSHGGRGPWPRGPAYRLVTIGQAEGTPLAPQQAADRGQRGEVHDWTLIEGQQQQISHNSTHDIAVGYNFGRHFTATIRVSIIPHNQPVYVCKV